MRIQRLLPTTLPCAALLGALALPAAAAGAEPSELFEKVLTYESKCTAECAKAAEKGPAEKYGKKAKAGYAAGECPGCGEVNPVAALVGALAKEPGAWSVVGPLLQERFSARSATEGQRKRMLEVLARESSETSLALASELFRAEPAAFCEDFRLAFAARGSEPVRAALAKAAAQGAVLPAAQMAFEGDAVGRRALSGAVGQPLTAENVAQTMVAAAALERLGEEGALRRARGRVHAEVLAQLDAGRTAQARELALRACYCDKLVSGAGRVQLGWLGEKVEGYCERSAGKYESADEVFELIERITPL